MISPRSFLLIALPFLLLLLCACENITAIRAKEFHTTTTYPLVFTHKIDATGVKKVTKDDGRVVRQADSLTTTLTVMGYTNTTVFTEAEIETLPSTEVSTEPEVKK